MSINLKIVEYSSSSEDEDSLTKPSKIPPKRVLLPNKIKDIQFGTQKTSEINQEENQFSEDNNGRIRSFAHERGNWATYVYIKCPATDLIANLQHQLIQHLSSNSQTQFHAIESLHISLTRTVVLKHHWIDLFIGAVKENLAELKRFTVQLSDVNVYCNDEGTRTFVGLTVAKKDCAKPKCIVNKLDKCLHEYKLPAFYAEASFHCSILWCLGNEKDTILKELSKMQEFLDVTISEDSLDFQINVDDIQCKTGNRLFSFGLK